MAGGNAVGATSRMRTTELLLTMRTASMAKRERALEDVLHSRRRRPSKVANSLWQNVVRNRVLLIRFISYRLNMPILK